MRILNNSQLTEMEDARERTRSELSSKSKVVLGRLASHIRDRYELALRCNWKLMDEMTSNHRQRQGEYDPEKLKEIKEIGGSTLFRRNTATKCVAAEAWINDILSPAEDRPWSMEPTPLPEISPKERSNIVNETVETFSNMAADEYGIDDVVGYADEMRSAVLEKEREFAKKASERMGVLIEDQLTEGGFTDAFREMVSYTCTFKYGVLKGPVIRRRKKLGWSKDMDGEFQMVRENVECMEFEAPNPMDIYFAPDMRKVDEGFIIEKQRYSRGDLYAMIGVEGYDEGSIRDVLDRAARKDIIEDEDVRRTDMAELRNRDASTAHEGESGIIEAVEYHGGASGAMLKDFGLTVDDVQAEYEIWAIMVQDIVIKAEINPDPLGRRPYYVTSFEKNPGSLVGFGIPDKMKDTQAMCNASMRALSNNLALASGPQIFIDPTAIPAGENIRSIRPLKIWQLDRKGMNGSLPVQFHQPGDNSRNLLAVYEKMKEESDDDTGIPRYIYGNQDVGGAGNTASGLSMLMNAASKGIKAVIRNFDQDVIRPLITRMYEYNMLHSKDPSVKGDLKVVARGALALVVKEQLNTARQEFMDRTANEYDMQLLGLEGRLSLLREIVKNLDMPDSMLPTVQQFRDRQAAEQEAAAEQQQQIMQQQMMMEQEQGEVAAQ